MGCMDAFGTNASVPPYTILLTSKNITDPYNIFVKDSRVIYISTGPGISKSLNELIQSFFLQ